MSDVAVKSAPSAVTESGSGRPVLALGPELAGSPGLAALAERFHVFAMPEGDAAAVGAWIAAHGLEKFGLVASGAAARAAVQATADAGGKVEALVLVSPSGLPKAGSDDAFAASMKALETPKLVMIGDQASDAMGGGLSAWRTAFSRCQTVLVYDSGENIAADRPAALASAAGDFLDRQGRFGFVAESVAISD
jgi:pimeloyl-ACP methyl ester carboxylesterase